MDGHRQGHDFFDEGASSSRQGQPKQEYGTLGIPLAEDPPQDPLNQTMPAMKNNGHKMPFHLKIHMANEKNVFKKYKNGRLCDQKKGTILEKIREGKRYQPKLAAFKNNQKSTDDRKVPRKQIMPLLKVNLSMSQQAISSKKGRTSHQKQHQTQRSDQANRFKSTSPDRGISPSYQFKVSGPNEIGKLFYL